jgi:general secretion pathway protein B
MSFILDALKKSEAERQRQSGPALLEMRVVAPRRRLPLWAVALAVLLVVNLGVLAWLGLHSASPPAPASGVAATPAASPAAQAPASAAPLLAAPAAEAVPPVAAASGMPEHNLAATAAADAAADAAEENPADTAPAVLPPRARAGAAPAHSVPNYTALSATLPPLRLDLHAWSELAAERYALINMHRVREGDTLPEGAHVQQITREGVVLEYRGTEFLLGRE